MRVAFIDFVCDPTRPGRTGLSDLVWDMARELDRLGDEIHIVAPYASEHAPTNSVAVHQFRLPIIGYRNILGQALIVLNAWRTLLEIGPVDVIHSPEYFSAALLSFLLPGTPLVFTEPGNIFERIKNGNPYDWITTQVYKLAALRSARSCTRLVATSDSMCQWWRWTGAADEKIVRIPLGVEPARFRRQQDAREQLGIPEDERVVLYAARLSRENGADVTLRAARQARSRLPGLRVHVLGDGPERPRLERLAAELGIGDTVCWHGWVDLEQLALYYSAADAFVFSGFSGGTPRTLIQAMACGAACVASDIGGIVDHVAHESTGLLVSPTDAEGFAGAIVRVLSDDELRRGLGRAAEGYALGHLTWGVLARRLRDEVYAPLLGGAGPTGLSSRGAAA